ncbi:DUF58 domain-containing protein [Bacillus sp. FJAT-49736]|uniref:DUF58 domain-containing protein n=1 Tax=Bacillus sp. FJAT-49736 TaxID=2833582 RepID=UPI001BC95BE3|nr:DUF58 domain-containing protein [Bacillus sp. FJAT-49736]MBS4172308.1 DUF58 domain-containing protein [Bacillus sp. FJAT-49736]
MIWDKEIIQEKSAVFLGQLMIVLAVLSFLFGSAMLLSLFIFGSLITLADYFYLKFVGNGLILQNDRSTVRLNVHDIDEWKLSFVNKGLPIIKGTIRIGFTNKVEPTQHPFIDLSSKVEVSIPFKAWRNEQVDINIPVKAIKRGVSRIQSIEIKIPHLFGTGEVILQNNKMLGGKKLIFPERKSVKTTNKDYYFLQGTQYNQTSIYFDPLQPIGTREYQSGDPFQYIHWKASARTQQLQTKVFSAIGAKTWLMLMNVEGNNADLETNISHCAYLVDYAVKENIPFALAINVTTFGESMYYFLNEGEGRQHRQRAFDLLTYLSVASFTIPYKLMLKNIFQNGISYPYIIHIGKVDSFTHATLLSFSKKGSMVFSVKSFEDQGAMELWN